MLKMIKILFFLFALLINHIVVAEIKFGKISEFDLDSVKKIIEVNGLLFTVTDARVGV